MEGKMSNFPGLQTDHTLSLELQVHTRAVISLKGYGSRTRTDTSAPEPHGPCIHTRPRGRKEQLSGTQPVL